MKENKIPQPGNISRRLMFLLCVFLLFIGVTSCKSYNYGRAVHRFDKAKAKCDMSKDIAVKAVPLERCRSWYPTKPPVIKTTPPKFLPGTKVTVHDTVTVDCDCAKKKGVRYVKAPCPPAEYIHDTLVYHDSIFVPDTYALHDCEITSEDWHVKYSKEYDKVATLKKWAWGCGITAASLLALFIIFIILLAKGKIR